MTTVSTGKPIGLACAAWRERNGVRQEELERALRQYGVPWPASTISRFERGDRDLRLGEAYGLISALQKLAGKRVTWTELLGKDEVIRVTDKLTIPVSSLPHPGYQRTTTVGLEVEIRYSIDAPDATERRIARTLRVRPEIVHTAGRALFGRSFTAERDHRLLERTNVDPHLDSRGLRSAISRALVSELRNAIGKEGN